MTSRKKLGRQARLEHPSTSSKYVTLKKWKERGKYLSEETAQHFHHSVEQLLFLSTMVKHDIQTAVAFLTTWVKNLT
jgi:hypothetical protein